MRQVGGPARRPPQPGLWLWCREWAAGSLTPGRGAGASPLPRALGAAAPPAPGRGTLLWGHHPPGGFRLQGEEPQGGSGPGPAAFAGAGARGQWRWRSGGAGWGAAAPGQGTQALKDVGKTETGGSRGCGDGWSHCWGIPAPRDGTGGFVHR